MSNNDYVKPPKKSALKNTTKAMKGAYSYLNPNYRNRKLVHLIIVVPMVFIFYTIVYDLIFRKITGMVYDEEPWIIKAIYLIILISTVLICAYFYPFALWWYKQSFTGATLDNMVYVGSTWGVLLRKLGNVLFGILLAGIMAPITGPIALRKCRKKNMIIGEEGDFQ